MTVFLFLIGVLLVAVTGRLVLRAALVPRLALKAHLREILGINPEQIDGSESAELIPIKAPASGQYGISLHETVDDSDLGLYALRFNAKYPVLQVQTAAPLPSGYAGTFESVYPSGTDLYGFSFSTYVGDSNVAGEISGRRSHGHGCR